MAADNPTEFGYDVIFAGEEERTSAQRQNIGENNEFAGGINKDDITCAICHLILRDPVQAGKCGHRFCTKCIGQFHQTNPGKCPMDWQVIQVFPDIGKKREILSLKIRCQNYNEGCTWKNELREQENHLKTCGHQQIPCQLNCGNVILRKNMTRHLNKECRMMKSCQFRIYGCTFKGTESSLDDHIEHSRYQHISLEMKHEISKVKNEFDGKLQEKDDQLLVMKNEFDGMRRKVVVMKNEFDGMRRKVVVMKNEFDEKLQEKDNKLLDIKYKFDRIKEKERIEEDFLKLNEKLANENKLTFDILTTPRCPYVWKIENFKTEFEEAKQSNTRIYSPKFFDIKGYKGQIYAYLNGYESGMRTHISTGYLNLLGPYDKMLQWPIPYKSFTFILIVNNEEVSHFTHKSVEDGGKWKKIFRRPYDEKGQSLRESETFKHELVDNVTDNDDVAIKYDMEFY